MVPPRKQYFILTSKNQWILFRKWLLNFGSVHSKHMKIREKIWANFYVLMVVKETGFFSQISISIL